MALGDIIKRLKKEDPKRIIPLGWDRAFSYRGDYSQVAFEVANDVAVWKMLSVAEAANGKTFTGYKGGEFKMDKYTDCYLVPDYSSTSDDMIGPLLLDFLLQSAPDPQ